MPPGSTVQLWRIIVKLGNGWGTVQAGLNRMDADALLTRLLDNEARRQETARLTARNRPYIPPKRRRK